MSKITFGLKLCLSFNWMSEFQVSGTPAFLFKILLKVNGKSDFKFINFLDSFKYIISLNKILRTYPRKDLDVKHDYFFDEN